MATARCPNCTRKLHIWNNHSGFCSKQCRDESSSSCLNCSKIGLFKHERLGCCSDECRYWYVTTLLGYDRDSLLTPAWDKVVYHVRLPSASAEISSLQLEELEFERARDTILVLAAPAWIARQKVLAELPFQRFENVAWQHLREDGTLSPEEVDRFRAMCFDDPLLYHKFGVHVIEKIHGRSSANAFTPPPTPQFVPGTMALTQPLFDTAAASDATVSLAAPLQLAQVSQAGASLSEPEHFSAQVRTLFALRGYQVTRACDDAENALLLSKGNKRAIAVYSWQPGMVDVEPVQLLLKQMSACEATKGYVVTNGHFTLQVEDLVAGKPVQLIDGHELALLVDGASIEGGSAEPDTAARASGDTAMLEQQTDAAAVAIAGTGELLERAGQRDNQADRTDRSDVVGPATTTAELGKGMNGNGVNHDDGTMTGDQMGTTLVLSAADLLPDVPVAVPAEPVSENGTAPDLATANGGAEAQAADD
jgi:hypothetical protein